MFTRVNRPASFEQIRMRIISKWMLDGKDSCPVIAFTSRLPREGVSTMVAELARKFGASDPGNVLVLDVTAQLRYRKTVTDMLHASPKDIGFDELRSDNFDPLDNVTHNEKLGVDVLAVKHTFVNGSGQRLVKSLLDRMRSRYHLIFVDAGPLVTGNGLNWLTNSDYRILVIDSSRTTHKILEHQRLELEHSGLSMDGAILNKRKFHIPNFLYWLVR